MTATSTTASTSTTTGRRRRDPETRYYCPDCGLGYRFESTCAVHPDVLMQDTWNPADLPMRIRRQTTFVPRLVASLVLTAGLVFTSIIASAMPDGAALLVMIVGGLLASLLVCGLFGAAADSLADGTEEYLTYEFIEGLPPEQAEASWSTLASGS